MKKWEIEKERETDWIEIEIELIVQKGDGDYEETIFFNYEQVPGHTIIWEREQNYIVANRFFFQCF